MYSYNKTTNNKFCSWVLFDSFVVHKFITYNRLTISKFSFVTAEPILRPFVDNEEETKALNSMSFIGCSSASDVLIMNVINHKLNKRFVLYVHLVDSLSETNFR